MRRHLNLACDGAAIAATLDDAPGQTGLLIVSGGNEIRSGAHRGMAILAERIARAGHPVLRFDRRGIGDSEGDNLGFERSGRDIAAAIAGFRAAAPHVEQVVGFGNCDGASALLLHQPLPLAALILANPWSIEQAAAAGTEADTPPLPPSSAIRARYLARLKDPASLARLLRGEIDLRKLARGLGALRQRKAAARPGSLAERLDAAMASLACPATILLASGDRTAQAFAENCRPGALPIETLSSSSHSFAGSDADWLFEQVLKKVSAQASTSA